VETSAYEDWSDAGQPTLAGKTSQGVVEVSASDSHSCPCGPPDCNPYLYEITFSLQHTLAESSSGPSGVLMQEDLGSLTVGGTWK
jgi:hypothetical protein